MNEEKYLSRTKNEASIAALCFNPTCLLILLMPFFSSIYDWMFMKTKEFRQIFV